MKFFPPTMNAKMRNEITSFKKQGNEPLFEAWLTLPRFRLARGSSSDDRNTSPLLQCRPTIIVSSILSPPSFSVACNLRFLLAVPIVIVPSPATVSSLPVFGDGQEQLPLTSNVGESMNVDSTPNETQSAIPSQSKVVERKLTSDVWNHFNRQNMGGKWKAVCNYCGSKLLGETKMGTSHLRDVRLLGRLALLGAIAVCLFGVVHNVFSVTVFG